MPNSETEKRLQDLKQNIDQAVLKSKFKNEPQLIVVTKTIAPEKIKEAYESGIRNFGENKVQELVVKYEVLPKDIRWHLIGHLQTNKVRQVIDKIVLLQSLDSLSLAKTIQKEALKKQIDHLDCLIQVNTSREISKFGIDPDTVMDFLVQLEEFDKIRIKGFMTIGPLTDDPIALREAFGQLRTLRDQAVKTFPERVGPILSMGMSTDYEMAISEGTDMVRVGSLIFPR